MKTCTGTSQAWAAAEPDWWAQLEDQLQAAYSTIEEINDPSLIEAFEDFDRLVGEAHKRSKLECS